MTTHQQSADLVFDGKDLLSDQTLTFENGIVTGLDPTDEPTPNHHKGLISCGYFDIQVNGGGGVMLNSDPTPQGIAAIADAHRRFGTTALLPTVISDTPDITEAAVEACIAARAHPSIVGLHIEGPHIAPARRGTHQAAMLRPLDGHTLRLIRNLKDAGLAALVTLAPETASTHQISEIVAMGGVVALGHSDATAVQTRAALDAGATGFTHLYNAMSPMGHREPGVVGTAINADAWCSVIADGIHVTPEMLMLAYRARPQKDRMIAVSDAMATVGGPEHFSLYGQDIHLHDGKLVNAEGALAGAHLTMQAALENLTRYGVSLQSALRMCRHNPAQFMGLWPQMGLIGSRQADLIHRNHKGCAM